MEEPEFSENRRLNDDGANSPLPPTNSSGVSPWSRKYNGEDGELREAQRLARSLGWFSIGLGVAQLAAPETVARLVGIKLNPSVMRMLGIREIINGLGIFSRRRPVGWLWSRVLGDFMDMALLATAGGPGSAAPRRLAAGAAVASVTVLDFQAAERLATIVDRFDGKIDETIHIRQTLVINREAQVVYRYWRDFKNLPQVLTHLESVECASGTLSHWRAKGPAGTPLEWDAQITEDRPDQLIAWHSVGNSAVEISGSVHFDVAPGGRGTLLRVELHYLPPAGTLGATIAKLMGSEPELELKTGLRRLKQMLETGEIITTEGQPAGRESSKSWKFDEVVPRLATTS